MKPKTFEELIIPNKEELISFIEERFETNDLNIGLIGPYDTCKTTIANLIINRFLNLNSTHMRDKIFFNFDCFNDYSLQNMNGTDNAFQIFCQRKVNSNKLVYINKMDNINVANQQLLKIYMDRYNSNILKQINNIDDTYKIYFIIEANKPSSIKDILASRLNIYRTELLGWNEHYQILSHQLDLYNISITDNAIDRLMKISNLTLSVINNFIKKIRLLNIDTIDVYHIDTFINLIKSYYFENYLNFIETNENRNATNVLMSLYNEGYDISDIYIYLYDYIRQTNNEKYFKIINLICFYINELYNDNNNKITFLLFTNDVLKIMR